MGYDQTPYYYFIPDIRRVHADNGGCAIVSPGWVHPRRRLDSTVIILGRKGTTLIEEEGHLIEIKPDRICILGAERAHCGMQPIGQPISYYWMHFSLPGAPLTMTGDEAGLILNSREVTDQRLRHAALVKQELDIKDPEPFHRLFHDLLYEQERPSYSSLKFQLQLHSLLIALTEVTIREHRLSRTPDKASGMVYAIISAVAEDLVDPSLCVKSIADSLRHNPDYLGRQFKQTMGISIGEYILQQRIKMALTHLRESYETVSTIAERCGFGTVRHFLRQFKAVHGITPTELRKRYRAMHINSN